MKIKGKAEEAEGAPDGPGEMDLIVLGSGQPPMGLLGPYKKILPQFIYFFSMLV